MKHICMKSIIQTQALIGVLVILVTGCAKKLDQYPNYEISTPTFWKTASDAALGLQGCYANVTNIAYDYWYFDGGSDNCYDQYPWESGATYISAGTLSSGLINGINGDYTNEYQSIRSCNTFLDNIGNVTMDGPTKTQYIGEVTFLRAFDYFLLAQMFGDVPLITSSKTTSDSLAPAPEANVISFVENELDSASNLLPATPAGGGRVAQGAALALLARVQLFYKQWSDAAATALQVINSGNYSLFKVKSLSNTDTLDDYSSLVNFANETDKQNFYLGLKSYQDMYLSANEGNPEFIFECQFSPAAPYEYTGLANAVNTLLPPSDLNGWSSIDPTQSLVDCYWNRDGSVYTPITQATSAGYYNWPGTPAPAYFNQFKNRDPRLYASIWYSNSTWNDYASGYTFIWQGPGNNNSATGYNFRKLLDPAFAAGPSWQAGQSFPLIRYAEVLLTYAEAQNEATGPGATVYAALDSIRSRAGVAFVNQTVYNTQATLRTLIQNERRIELAEEGTRYFDIRRWGIAANVMTTVYDNRNTVTQPRIWQANFAKLPYPQAAVEANPLLQAAQTAKGY
jgi:hypothetical protein